MKNAIFATLFFLTVQFTGSAQELEAYKYVRVPEKFEFLNEENQYQLNALTEFLFEKYGFQALYKEPRPAGVTDCEVLQGNVHDDSNWFRSRLHISLTDCHGKEVFTSEIGASSEKNYKKSYNEALREAFKSLEGFNFMSVPKEVVVDPFVSAEEMEELENDTSEEISETKEVIVDPLVPSKEIEDLEEDQTNEPVAGRSLQKFTNGNSVYHLKETPAGFDLFKAGETEKFATMVKSGSGKTFLYSSKNVRGNAFFDTRGNLVVEYLDPNSGQLLTVQYKLQD